MTTINLQALERISRQKIDNLATAREWLRDLNAYELMWHMDDDVRDIEDFEDLDEEILTRLDDQQTAAWTMFDDRGLDIHEFCLELFNGPQGA